MSKISKGSVRPRMANGGLDGPRADDPRVVRSRAAVVDAARTLFLREGYAGTTMEAIAGLAGLTKRTVYNHFGDKDALFTEVVMDMIGYAEEFAAGLRDDFAVGITAGNLRTAIDDLGRRLALAVVRPEVIALRRLLIGEAGAFPTLAREYFDRAPGKVIAALAVAFGDLSEMGFLSMDDSRRAAAQFAYLVTGELLDRAMLVGTTPGSAEITACARDGVATFLARYGVAGGSGR